MKKYFIPASVEPVLPASPAITGNKVKMMNIIVGIRHFWMVLLPKLERLPSKKRISGIVDLRQSQSCQSRSKGTNPDAVVPDSSRVYDYIKSEFDLSACGRRRTLSSSRSSVGSVNVTFLARREREGSGGIVGWEKAGKAFWVRTTASVVNLPLSK